MHVIKTCTDKKSVICKNPIMLLYVNICNKIISKTIHDWASIADALNSTNVGTNNLKSSELILDLTTSEVSYNKKTFGSTI